MESGNNVTYFVLLGLTQNPKVRNVLSVLFLFIYLLTLVGNLLIIVTLAINKTLSSLMYFFSRQLIMYGCHLPHFYHPQIDLSCYSGKNTYPLNLV